MSESQRANVRLVERVNEISNAQGLRGIVDRFDEICLDDFEWRPRMVGFGKDAYLGRDGMRRYVDDMEATVGVPDLTVAEIRPVGSDHVLLVGRLAMVGKGSGVPLDSEWAILYRVAGDLLQSGVAFDSHAEAEEAASHA